MSGSSSVMILISRSYLNLGSMANAQDPYFLYLVQYRPPNISKARCNGDLSSFVEGLSRCKYIILGNLNTNLGWYLKDRGILPNTCNHGLYCL